MNEYFSISQSTLQAHFSCDFIPDKNQFTIHTHEHCELYVFFEGNGYFKVEGTSYRLNPGDVLIMAPGEAHYIDINSTTPYERLAIHFDPYIFSSFDPTNALLEPFFKRKRGRLNIYRREDFKTDSYLTLINNIILNEPDKNLQVVSNLFPLLLEIKRAFDCKKTDNFEETTVQKIIEYINVNLSEKLSLDNICTSFYISKPQLCRIFKAATGVSVWEYITAKRLMTARMLISTGHTPTHVSEKCGFNDYSVFYKAYKKRFGVSPKKRY